MNIDFITIFVVAIKLRNLIPQLYQENPQYIKF